MKRESPVKYETLDGNIKRDMHGKGTYCSHCGQHVKMYIKPLSASIATFLIHLYRAHQRFGDERFFTTRELYPKDNKASTEGVLARHWGFIEVADATNENGAPAGAYRLTNSGRRFVQGVEHVKSHVHTYNGEFIKLDGMLRDIRQALRPLDYDEVMKEI